MAALHGLSCLEEVPMSTQVDSGVDMGYVLDLVSNRWHSYFVQCHYVKT